MQVRGEKCEIWSNKIGTAVAEHSGDTAFRIVGCVQKRRRASLVAAVQNISKLMSF